MSTLKLELVDQDGRAICRGNALIWVSDVRDGRRWGGEFYQIEERSALPETTATCIRTADGETYRVCAQPCEERSSGAQRTVSLRFQGQEERCPSRDIKARSAT